MEKRCFKCGKTKELLHFYKHAAMRDGHLNKCKECTKQDVNKHRQENLLKIRAYDRMRGAMPHRLAASKERGKSEKYRQIHKGSMAKYLEEHPERVAAATIVGNALRSKRLTRLPCLVCGNVAEAHHADYSRPLDVMWLCVTHHKEVHKLTRRLRGEVLEIA